MIADIRTVMWKEWRGLFRQRGGRARTVLTLVSPIGLAVYLPLSIGIDWVDMFFPVVLAVITAVILTGIAIPDSFAGEREHHTLATLLASRLPDRAILFGKVAVALVTAMAGAVVVLLAGLVTVNIANWGDGLLFYTPTIAVLSLTFGFLTAGFIAGLGVLISLRASTAQEASQILLGVVMVVPMALSMVFFAVARSKPEWKDSTEDILGVIGSTEGKLIAVAVLLVLIAGLFAAALARFKRARLIHG